MARGPRDLLRLSRAANRADLDAFLFPCVDSYFPVFGLPAVVGLYDTILDDMRDQVLPGRRSRALWRVKQSWAMRRSERLFTLSEAARDAFVRRFPVTQERLSVVPAAPDPCFFPRPADEARPQLEALGLGAGQDFLLYAGGIGAHKNLETLLTAYSTLRRQVGQPPPLVIVGPFQSPAYAAVTAPIRELVAELELERDLRWPGFVGDEALACLYSQASAVIVTSLAEGFGLPAVEAAACGAPLALSDIPPHREFLGDGALYFPATDPAALTECLSQLLGDRRLREAVAQRGAGIVAGLSWDESARRLRELIHAAAARSARRAG